VVFDRQRFCDARGKHLLTFACPYDDAQNFSLWWQNRNAVRQTRLALDFLIEPPAQAPDVYMDFVDLPRQKVAFDEQDQLSWPARAAGREGGKPCADSDN
jgi:hypothetical protein